jgi:hypothetical protein
MHDHIFLHHYANEPTLVIVRNLGPGGAVKHFLNTISHRFGSSMSSQAAGQAYFAAASNRAAARYNASNVL